MSIEQRIITKPVYGVFYLLVIVVFASQAYLLFGYYGAKSEEVAIDTAGRQRMLSQRIAKNLLLMQLHGTQHEKEGQLEQVALDLALLKQTQLKLEKNNIFVAKELTEQLTNVVMHIHKMYMSHVLDAEQLNTLFKQYLQLERLFVAVIDKITVTQQKKMTEAVQAYQSILWLSIAGTVLCFFMGIFFIVCPTINKVRASLGLLARSNAKQQHLIAELERKNAALKTAGDFAQQSERDVSAQALLVLQQKRFTDAILNSSHEAIISITSKGLINLFSAQAEKKFGYTADEVYLENVKILMPSPFKSAHDGHLKNYSHTGKKNIIGVGREVQGKKKDGTTFPLFLRVVEIKMETEHAFVGFIKDLSEIRNVERQVRANDRRYKAVVEDQTDLICRYTVGFVLTFANQAYCRYFGVRQEDIIGTSILGLLPEGIAAWFVATHAALSADSPIHIHEDKTRHNGKMEWHHWSTRAIFAEDGQTVIEFQGVGSIVTDRKLAELNAILAKEAADKANMAKSQFLSSMSHELRTPLNSIIGFSQLMELDESEPLSESQLDSVLQINNAGNHLLKLINEILDLSSIESGQITFINEDFDLVNVCADVLSIVKTLVTKKAITITTDCESNKYWVSADYMRSKQVFLNILSNAIKYNHEQGGIHVEVTQQGQFVLISFTDTGVGIKEEALPELFKPFNRLGYESSAIEGTGIGLSLTKRLVEQMGGEIGVNSEFGEGSTFWVKLPAAKGMHGSYQEPVKQSLATIDQDSQPFHKCRLLYIEDNPANMILMGKIIRQLEGFTLFEAVDAEIGINMFEQVRPDIVLMDIDLPGMNGFDALLAIRTRFAWAKNIPVIAVSSNAMAEEVEKGKHSGFYDYITKPIDTVNLTDMLQKLTPYNSIKE